MTGIIPLAGALACALVALSPPSAGAALLRWDGAVELDFLHPALPTLTITGAGVATVEGAGGGPHLSRLRIAGGISGSTVVPVTDPAVASTLAGIAVAASLGTGDLTTSGTLPLRGTLSICLLSPGCGAVVPLALTRAGGATGVGVGGLLTVGGPGATLQVSLRAAPWTLHTGSVPVPTELGGSIVWAQQGWVHGPLSFTSSTAVVGGALSLVTPLAVTSETGQSLASFGRLTLRFVPEPRAALLLGVGVAALLALARKRLSGPRSAAVASRGTNGRPPGDPPS